MLEKGTVVFGNWSVEEEIGSGAFGTVYKIKREEFGSVYYSAMKVLRIPQDKDEHKRLRSEGMDDASISTYYSQVVQDFVSEIELLSSLDGITNIVDYKDHIIEPNDNMGYTIYIKMQLLTPISDTLMNSDGSVRFMDEEEIIKLGKDMCSALEVCEKRNIIHRDIKIDNIFVSENGDYKLGDFGIAKQLEATQGEMSKKGTLLYMAPEVFRGEKYDKTADIYSLGIVLYRLLNKNRAPFFPNYPDPIKFSDKETANTKRLKGEEFPDIIGISAELNAVLKKACAFNPKDRYLSANEFKSALNSVSFEGTGELNPPVYRVVNDDEATIGIFGATQFTKSNSSGSSAKPQENLSENDNKKDAFNEKSGGGFDEKTDFDLGDLFNFFFESNDNGNIVQTPFGRIHVAPKKADGAFDNTSTSQKSDVQNGTEYNPGKAQILCDKADIAYAQSKPGEAISLLNEAIEYDPSNAKIWTKLGRAHRLAGNLDYARDCYQKALKIKPNDIETIGNLGVVEIYSNNYELAYKYCKYAYENGSNVDASINAMQTANFAVCLAKLGRKKEAMKIAKIAKKRGYKKYDVIKDMIKQA